MGKVDAEDPLLTADVNLVASGVSKDATPEQLKQFIISKGINVTDIELLTAYKKEEARSYSYRIAIKPEDYEKALKPDVWPYRVGVRLYKQKRLNNQNQSWSQQSGQTGGNILEQNRNNRNSQNRKYEKHTMPTSAMNDGYLDVQNRYVVPGFEAEVFN